MSAGGSAAGASSGRTTSVQRLASSGSSASVRTVITCIGPAWRRPSSTGRMRASRSSSAISTFGRLSASPYSSSGVVHHALSPTTAAPIDVIAQ